MYQMVVLVLDELEVVSDVLDAWEGAGVSGVTILESTGLGRVRQNRGIRDDIPFMPSIERLLQTREEEHRTLFSLVDSDEMVDKLIDVTTAVTGDLNGPNRGIFFVLPVSRAVGIRTRTEGNFEEGDG
ncbi:MAG: P-II family nitrogen regulator [Caldilineaceae bacterium]|nr:P-II family nitrogen regulator [Caldilineaceae bacterium]